jgi:RNA polymerase sigma factor (sigma-70 family)
MVGAPSDAELIARCRAADDAAWALLVERFARYVHAILARAYRLPAHVVEDTFQDVFASVYEQLPKLRDDAAFRPWLAQLTRRLAIDALRAGGRGLPADGELIEYLDIAADDAIVEFEQALTVRAALETLPAHCADVLERFFARNESYATIGAALGIPAGAIASRIRRCLERMRHNLEARAVTAAPSGGT